MDLYILDGHTPVRVGSTHEWAHWFETADRHVAFDVLPLAKVSTIFLGIDHGWGTHKHPVLFETMVFAHPALKGDLVDFCGRCCTWEQAERMHAQVLAKLLPAHQEAAG